MPASVEDVVMQFDDGAAVVPPSEAKPPPPPRKAAISWRNWSAVVAYIVNLVITYLSMTGLFGQTNSNLSAKYQTLVTPAGWAFAIWGLIFVAEGIAVVAQMFPRFRALEVTRVSAPWWSAVCICQICWTFAFAREAIGWSLALMLGILVSLIGMALCVDAVRLRFVEYLFLRAPFAIHLGWIICATAVNVNVLVDSLKASPETLLGVALLSLAGILLVVAVFTLVVKRPEPSVGFVAAWALAAVAVELGRPEKLLDTSRFNPHAWDLVTLSGVGFAVKGLSVTTGLMGVVAVAFNIVACLRAWVDEKLG